MMNREQTINKIMEEYSKFGIVRRMAEQVYDSAIQVGVSQEIIYPGMKMMFNQALGIDNTEAVKEVGDGFKEYAVNDTRKANPTVTDKVIAKNFKEELEDDFKWEDIPVFGELKNAIKQSTEKFIKDNE